MRAYRDSSSGTEPIALIAGRVTPDKSDGVPTRIHDSCFTSEVIGECASRIEECLNIAFSPQLVVSKKYTVLEESALA